jgi:hypothetical protein
MIWKPTEMLTPDSACTDTYVEMSYPVINKRPTQNPIHIHTADGGITTSTHEAELDSPIVNVQARYVHAVPGLWGCSLLSIARLRDSGYEVTFDKVTIRILQNGICILQGQRNPSNNLWKIDSGDTVAMPPDIWRAPQSITSKQRIADCCQAKPTLQPTIINVEHLYNNKVSFQQFHININPSVYYTLANLLTPSHCDTIRNRV